MEHDSVEKKKKTKKGFLLPVFLRDAYIQVAVMGILGISALSLGIALTLLRTTSEPIIIHFIGKYGVIDYSGTKADFLNIWLIAFYIHILNILLARLWFHRNKFAAQVLVFSSLALGGLILLVIGVIVSVNQ
ncbi:MAG: hypothetical protein COU08_04310 [Candidatus Harrisonbacteria bacterium CG10_big_fil_rev_8_21_14_0_10_42_17]|uniref:Uncharacterized protein n=1 Tax=Candidatus Harrisonbacteria bacterium CG10_big_fil_rev_8_21_14_0_10_42_17 TaxID=1974584 RepID=A0A2M6WGY2_9BACT|nr:MAG: hypothetical protein COU08_04310 [Candidatus Harrisonbacteria bacterium CG10_big_fil_rev_8_21_14_0_10_42_17]